MKNLLIFVIYYYLFFMKQQFVFAENVDTNNNINNNDKQQQIKNRLRKLHKGTSTSTTTNNNVRKLQKTTTTPLTIIGFSLYNTVTNEEIDRLINGQTIYLKEYNLVSSTQLAIGAIVLNNENENDNEIGSIQFEFDELTTYNNRIENVAPYTLCGDVLGIYRPCTELTLGEHTIKATPYSYPDRQGISGKVIKVTFNIEKELPKTNTLIDSSCEIPMVRYNTLSFYKCQFLLFSSSNIFKI